MLGDAGRSANEYPSLTFRFIGQNMSMNSDAVVRSGDPVEIIAGQFVGATGTVEKINGDHLTVMIDGMEPGPGNLVKPTCGTQAVEFPIETSRQHVRIRQ